MLALYLKDLGRSRFDVLLLVQKEGQISLDGTKRILAGDRLKVMTGDYR